MRDNYKGQKVHFGHHDLDPLALKSDAFILAEKSISDESSVKFRQQIPNIPW